MLRLWKKKYFFAFLRVHEKIAIFFECSQVKVYGWRYLALLKSVIELDTTLASANIDLEFH